VDGFTVCGHHVTMKTVRIAALKSPLSRHLREVRAGEIVTVLDRDTPIARLVPIDSGDDVIVSKPTANPPSLARIRLPRGAKLDVDVVTLLV
jgi:antitoxin (DNA-binding transcriptional repressor) of toxin-antitoxin stability system